MKTPREFNYRGKALRPSWIPGIMLNFGNAYRRDVEFLGLIIGVCFGILSAEILNEGGLRSGMNIGASFQAVDIGLRQVAGGLTGI